MIIDQVNILEEKIISLEERVAYLEKQVSIFKIVNVTQIALCLKVPPPPSPLTSPNNALKVST